MKIGEVCKETGLTVRTIRFYIEEELVFPKKSRNKFSGRTDIEFEQKDLNDLKEIMLLRTASLTLAEIKSLRADKQRIVEFALKSKQLLAKEIADKSEVFDAIGFVDETLTYEQFIFRLKSVKNSGYQTNKNILKPKFRIVFLIMVFVIYLFNVYVNVLAIGLGSPTGQLTIFSIMSILILVVQTAAALISIMKPKLGFIYLFAYIILIAVEAFIIEFELTAFWLGVYFMGIVVYMGIYLLQMREYYGQLYKK